MAKRPSECEIEELSSGKKPDCDPEAGSFAMTVFGNKDIVSGVIAPFLSLLSLFQLSRVCKRLQTILATNPTLNLAKQYTGRVSDFKLMVCKDKTDLRVTRYMTCFRPMIAHRTVNYQMPVPRYTLAPGTWWRAAEQAIDNSRDCKDTLMYIEEHLVLPLLKRSPLPDEELTRHVDLIYQMGNLANIQRRYESDYTDTIDRDTAALVTYRIQNPKLAVTLLYRYCHAFAPANVYKNAFLQWASKCAQMGANKTVRDALINELTHPASVWHNECLLLASAMSNPAFFDNEYVRLGSVSLENLTVFCALAGSDEMFSHVISRYVNKETLHSALRKLTELSSDESSWTVAQAFAFRTFVNDRELLFEPFSMERYHSERMLEFKNNGICRLKEAIEGARK